MSLTVVLDSGPLGLLVHRKKAAVAQACRTWLHEHLAAGTAFVVPAIADYEVRRELLRIRSAGAIHRLDVFREAHPDRYLSLTDDALARAAELWALARQQGRATADPSASDADTILAAQVLTATFQTDEVIVATTNVAHLSQLVRADLWQNIRPP